MLRDNRYVSKIVQRSHECRQTDILLLTVLLLSKSLFTPFAQLQYANLTTLRNIV